MNPPPLQWTIDLSAIGHAAAAFSFEASTAELMSLKRYVEVEDLTSFKAKLRIVPIADDKFRVTGTLWADAVQSSIVDLSAVRASIEESFSVEYWPAALIQEVRDEAGAPFDEDQPEPIVEGRIPIGLLLGEILAISVDPYPRNEGDVFEWEPRAEEPEASPFAELSRLRRPKEPNEP
jgi:hypothetical protein